MAHISPGGLSPNNQNAAFAASSNGRVTSAFYSYYDLDYAGAFTIKGSWRYVTAVNLQIADRPLFSTEQFAIGGEGGSRTYVYDDQSFDSGVVWRNEIWGPPLRLAISKPLPLPTQPYVFLDGAYGQDMRGGPHQFASSTGMGLNWSLSSHLSGSLVGGWSLINAAYTRSGQFKLLAKVNAAF
jgi:hemolysin activation/secretion protein